MTPQKLTTEQDAVIETLFANVDRHQYDCNHCRCDLCNYTGVIRALRERLAFVELELIKTQDDVECDATDHAHPAWWRGYDAGAEGAMKRWREALEGKLSPTGTLGSPKMQGLRAKTESLTTENRVLREAIFDVLAKGSGKGCPSCGSYLGDAMDSQPHAKECKIAAALHPSAASTAAQEGK